MPDLWLPTQPSIPPESVNDYGGVDHQTADHGCIWLFCRRSKFVGAGLNCAAYRLYARSVCDTKTPLQLQLRLVAKCYMPLLLDPALLCVTIAPNVIVDLGHSLAVSSHSSAPVACTPSDTAAIHAVQITALVGFSYMYADEACVRVADWCSSCP